MKSCPLCQKETENTGISISEAPLFHLLPKSKPTNPRLFGNIDLRWCKICDHYFNAADVLPEPSPWFATNQSVSTTMTQRQRELSRYLLGADGSGLSVLDVGAGSGGYTNSFLEVGCEVVVVEPNVDLSSLSDRCLVIKDRWPLNQILERTFDIIVCIQVIEHMSDPVGSLRAMLRHLNPEGILYLELPSADWIFDHQALFDIHLQHQQYFTNNSIRRCISECGAKIVDTRALFGGRDIGFSIGLSQKLETFRSHGNFQLRSGGLVSTLNYLLRQNDLEFALYGVGAGSQAFLGWFPEMPIVNAFDDTPEYWGNEIYSSKKRVSVLKPETHQLRHSNQLLITSYLHDVNIAKRLLEGGYRGRIRSLRPPNSVTDGPPSILG